jgi:uncharacterized protein YqgC (DUF456 family)
VTLVEVVVGLAILVGLAGIVVPVLPGTVLILVAVLVWATETGGATAWTVLGVSVVLLAAGTVVKYLVPGKQLKATVPTSTLVVGALVGLVGFFVIPVVGLLVGFVLGVYLAELARLREHPLAWSATVVALKATGITIVVELAGALVASAAWLVGALAVTA